MVHGTGSALTFLQFFHKLEHVVALIAVLPFLLPSVPGLALDTSPSVFTQPEQLLQ